MKRSLHLAVVTGLCGVLAACHRPEAPKVAPVETPAAEKGKAPASIGVATMEADGTLVLRLRAEDGHGLVGEGRLVYAPTDPDYRKILEHVGPLKKGESVSVPPWPDEK